VFGWKEITNSQGVRMMDESQSRVPRRLLRILLAGGILAGAWMLADAVFSTHSASAAGIDEIVPAVTETVTTPVISTVVEVTEPAIAPIVAATSTPVTAVIAAVSPVVAPLVVPLVTTIELLPLPTAPQVAAHATARFAAPDALPAPVPIGTPGDPRERGFTQCRERRSPVVPILRIRHDS
jgi:hypothetical protein